MCKSNRELLLCPVPDPPTHTEIANSHRCECYSQLNTMALMDSLDRVNYGAAVVRSNSVGIRLHFRTAVSVMHFASC